ncbi:polysaccharide deacetylase family protein [Clostridium sp. CS001]|uniref:polysaccharide deacetylase family protein n=1 Tax=Clostridium sp. CS001 TaxID=2880648 RepID=UPI001CF1CA08|nr:polysaccharide deacetylase family protein [Clostridium sp. CS001]MCB2289986.1 polysaccharide deacetylase family protein [Clostridium sp. CS001]
MNSYIKEVITCTSSFILTFESILNKVFKNNCTLLYLHMYPNNHGKFDEVNIRKNIKYLKENCNVVPLDHMFNMVYNNCNIPNRTVAVTVDDAKQSFYKYGYPILKEFDIPFTLGIIPGLIESDERNYLISKLMRIAGHKFYLDHEKMLYLIGDWFEFKELRRAISFNDVFDRIKYLSDESIKELIKYMRIPDEDFISWEILKNIQLNKNVRFACHTMSHPLLELSRGDWLHWELAESKALIDDNLKINVDTFILPYGNFENYSPELNNELVKLGYEYALYTERGAISTITNKLKIPRMNGEVKPNLFKVYTSSSLCRAIFGTKFVRRSKHK